MSMSFLITLCLLFGIFAASQETELDQFETFIEDIIRTWQLRSPTIIFKDDIPTLCRSHQWLLCISNDQDANELTNHLDNIHKRRKQDGLIFRGNQWNKELLTKLSKGAPHIFRSNIPIFMSIVHKSDLQLTLDSNILFYLDKDDGSYELTDIFSVKGGPLIESEVGRWKSNHGMTLLNSKNRWERRTNLQRATLLNCEFEKHHGTVEIVKDINGKIIDTKGYYPDKLYYITEKLNVTIEVIEAPSMLKLFDNGSWTGAMGFLQRREADVVGTGLGINHLRSNFIDFAIPSDRQPLTLIAKIPKGVTLNMWVYVEVFGVNQWIISR